MSRPNENRELERKIDRWLEAALERYIDANANSDAEPRSGLEERILAVMKAEEGRRRLSPWSWQLVAVAGTAAILAVAFWLAPWRGVTRDRAKPAAQSAKAEEAAGPVRSNAPAAEITRATAMPPSRRHTITGIGMPSLPTKIEAGFEAGAVAIPRLAQFPSPQPLSVQERLLVALVNGTSHEQLEEDAALQQRLRTEVLEARDAAVPVPPGN